MTRWIILHLFNKDILSILRFFHSMSKNYGLLVHFLGICFVLLTILKSLPLQILLSKCKLYFNFLNKVQTLLQDPDTHAEFPCSNIGSTSTVIRSMSLKYCKYWQSPSNPIKKLIRLSSE